MKTLVFIALSVVTSAAMAAGPVASIPDITITGNSTQVVLLSSVAANNNSTGARSEAFQNLAADTGNVTIGGKSNQYTVLANATVNNLSSGSNSKAVQNLASNNACFTCQPARTSGWPH